MNQELREQAMRDFEEFAKTMDGRSSHFQSSIWNYALEQRTLVLELKDKLRRYHEAATSWHNFHHGTAIQCDNICLAMDYAAPLLATIDQEKA